MATHRILYLFAEITSKKEYRSRMRAIEHILESRGLMDYTVKFDGSDPEHKALRNSMFKASGRRGEYPQVFLQPLTADLGFGSDIEFAGGFHEIQALNENEDEHNTLSAHFSRATGIEAHTTVDLKSLMEAASLGDAAVARALEATRDEADGAVVDATSEVVEDPFIANAGAVPEASASAVAALPPPTAEVSEQACAEEMHVDEEEQEGNEEEEAEAGAACDWQALETDSGEEFYFNSVTGETQWTKPEAMGGSDWQRFLDRTGKPYYFNRATGKSTWTCPDEIAE